MSNFVKEFPNVDFPKCYHKMLLDHAISKPFDETKFIIVLLVENIYARIN